MGRKKKYNRLELLEKAVDLFRDHGFAATSADMLVEHLGANRYSIYAEFGSKQGLFDEALEHYNKVNLDKNFGPLEAEGASLKEIKALLKFFGSAAKSPALGRGCFLCNTAVEFGPDDPSGAGYIQKYFKRISKAFYSALTNAKDKGEVADSINLEEEANFFTSSVLGLFVMLRAKAPNKMTGNAAKVAIRHLEDLCIESDGL